MPLTRQQLRKISRRFWGTLFTLVIALAVLVQLGRQTFPMLNDYKDQIAQLVGDRLGVVIEIEEVQASWSGLRPNIKFVDLKVSTLEDEEIFTINAASAELSIIDSVSRGSLAWRTVVCEDFFTTLIQDEKGRWQIRGLPVRQSSKDPFLIDDPLDIFILGRRIDITDASFDMIFHTGHTSNINISTIRLENDKKFHRAYANVRIGEDIDALNLIVEGVGDPRDQENFDMSGYLALNDFPSEKVLASIAGNFWHNPGENKWREGQFINAQLWFKGSPAKGTNYRGLVQVDGFPLELPLDIDTPSSLNSKMLGHWHPDKGWEVLLRDLDIAWPKAETDKLDLKLYGASLKEASLAIDKIDAEQWTDVLLSLGVENKVFNDAFTSLDLKGELRNIDVKITNKKEGYFLATANVIEASAQPYKGSPVVKGVSGFVSTTANDGFFEVEYNSDVTIALPKLLHDELSYDQASGQVAWHVNYKKEIAYVSSGLLKVKNANVQGQGYIGLKLPFSLDKGESQLTLSVGVKESDTKNYKTYVPHTIPKNLYDWLDDSVGEGRAANIAVVYNGSIENNPQYDPVIQISGEVYDGNIAFSPDWPELKKVSASMYLDNDKLDVIVDHAQLAGNQVNKNGGAPLRFPAHTGRRRNRR